MTAPPPGSTESLEDLLPPQAVAAAVEASDWESAVVAAGDLLVASGSTMVRYTEHMLAALHQHGPYIVISPGFALAHAQASDEVLAAGMSFVQLARPVRFGHATNDPVQLVVGLASPDHRTHMGPLLQLARALSTPGMMDTLRHATTADELHTLLLRRPGSILGADALAHGEEVPTHPTGGGSR
ncbi:MAG: PTS sugar transporter subunit IIA [Candidatus Nanopelagicales bacterium]